MMYSGCRRYILQGRSKTGRRGGGGGGRDTLTVWRIVHIYLDLVDSQLSISVRLLEGLLVLTRSIPLSEAPL